MRSHNWPCAALGCAVALTGLSSAAQDANPAASPPGSQDAAAPPSQFAPPRLLERVEAQYPEEARQRGLTATVLVQLVVKADGSVGEAQIAKGAGHGFDEAALEAARKLRFEPATQNGTAIPVQINYEVHFELEAAKLPTLRDTATGTRDGAQITEPTAQAMEAVVETDRPFSAASARTVRDRDFLLRPRVTPEDILRVVPGLVLAQHQGGGKADQLFLRGFDADHGTDVSVNIDGIPVNMPSHAHGQGYTDLHFLIPEALERVEITKGPYFAEYGDFDTAGAVNLITRRSFEQSQVSVSGGIFPTLSGDHTDGSSRRWGSYRVLGIAAPTLGNELQPFFAVEVYGNPGPFITSEKLERYNLYAKGTFQLGPRTTLSLLAMAYASSWIGSGQIPSRLVDSGVMDRFDAVDPTEGGDTQRQQVILSLLNHPDSHSTFTAALSAVRYGLTLYNDFHFQERDPLNGDEIEQDDQRTSVFANLKYERTDRLGPNHIPLITTLGAQLRSDDISASLWKVHQRVRLSNCLGIVNPCVNTNDRQTDAAVFLQEELRPIKQVRLVLGLRSDLFEFDVRSLKPDGGIDADHPAPLQPGVQRSIQSPKASLVVTPIEELDLYFNFGSGFHSNDARSVIESGGAGALPRALGYEIGARTRLFGDKVDLAAALWRLDLASELVWSGDDGGTTASEATRRQGLDLEARWQILSWLFADLDVSLSKSQYKADSGNGNAVALAPPVIATGGLTAQHPSGLKASLRVRHIGARPGSQLTSNDLIDPANPALGRVPQCNPALDATDPVQSRCYLTADGYTVLDATLGYSQPHYDVYLSLENLTNSVYREAQFGNDSQIVTAPPSFKGFVPEAHPVQDIHYTPGNPLGVQLTAAYKF